MPSQFGPGSLLLDHLPDAVVVVDHNGTIARTNPAAEQLLGWPAGALVGQPLVELVPDRLRPAHLAGFARALAGGSRLTGAVLRVPARRRDGGEVDVELRIGGLAPEGSGFVASLHPAGQEVLLLEQERARSGYLRLANELGAILNGAQGEPAEVALDVLGLLSTSLGFDLASLWLIDPEESRLRCLSTWCSPHIEAAPLVELNGRAAFRPGGGIPGLVWETGKVQRAFPEELDFLPRAQVVADAGLAFALAFPLGEGERLEGVVELFGRQAQEANADLDQTLWAVGRLLAQFLRRSRVETELRASRQRLATLAATLQASLLPPRLPQLAWLEVAARYRPAAGEAVVGGDFYDLFATRGQAWDLVLGDVRGRGPEAAALASLARHTLRAAAMQTRRPGDALAVLNTIVGPETGEEGFLSMLYARLRPTHGVVEVTIASAGHPLPYLVRSTGEVMEAGRPGGLIGVFPEPFVRDERYVLRPGDMLACFTDGVTEARVGDIFFEDHLPGVLAGPCGSAEELVERIETAMAGLGIPFGQDDMALVVLRAPDQLAPADMVR